MEPTPPFSVTEKEKIPPSLVNLGNWEDFSQMTVGDEERLLEAFRLLEGIAEKNEIVWDDPKRPLPLTAWIDEWGNLTKVKFRKVKVSEIACAFNNGRVEMIAIISKGGKGGVKEADVPIQELFLTTGQSLAGAVFTGITPEIAPWADPKEVTPFKPGGLLVAQAAGINPLS